MKSSTNTTTKVNADLEVSAINNTLKSIKIYYKDNSLKNFLDGFKNIKIQGIDIEFIKTESLLEDEDDFFDDEDLMLFDKQ